MNVFFYISLFIYPQKKNKEVKAADAPTKAGKPSDKPEKVKGVRKHLLAFGAADESRS